MKSSSKLALMAAAGILVGGVTMGSAKAADLGGDCCADLEERVAELEATSVRKGNRKVSLTISGQVHRVLMWFNDGTNSRLYPGIDSTASSTRWNFGGNAKITSSVTAGFDILMEWTSGARTASVSATSIDGATNTDSPIAIRTANWWLEDKTLGRVTVGRVDLQGPVTMIDLGGVGVIAPWSPALIGGSIVTGSGGTMASHMHPTIGADRAEGIRYNSASIGGFTFQGTWADQNIYNGSVRYAAEFGGVQFAAGVGYQQQKAVLQVPDGGLDGTSPREKSAWGGSVALKHVASGLFVQGFYTQSKYEAGTITASSNAATAVSAQSFTADFWMVQAGVSKNYFGPGNTNIYGEYARGNDYGRITANVSDTTADIWGLGIVQNIDAAAMELFLGWRHYDTDRTLSGVKTSGDLDVVTGGARIKF